MSCLYLRSARNIFLFSAFDVWAFPLMSRLFSSSVSDGTEMPADKHRISQIPFEIHLKIANSVLRCKIQPLTSQGMLPGMGFLHKQVSGTGITHSFCV